MGLENNISRAMLNKGARGLAIASMVLSPACGYGTVRPGQIDANHSVVRVAATPTFPDILATVNTPPPAGSMAESLTQNIKSKYGIEVGAGNWDIEKELEILSSLLDKIPAAGYLGNAGIGIHKEDINTLGGVLAIVPFIDSHRGGGNIMLGKNFDPQSSEGLNTNAIHRTNHREYLEWNIGKMFGYLFVERVGPLNFFDADEDEISQHPIFSTFAKVAGWQFGQTSHNVPVMTFDLNSNNFTSGTKKYKGWYKITPDGQYDISIIDDFADFFAKYVLQPDLLNPQQYEYFNAIQKGLNNNPHEFIDQIRNRNNPDL